MPVIVPELPVVVVVAPVPVVAAARDPVHVAPVGQQATFFALSVVHIEPAVQHAPSYFEFSAEQESWLAGQEPALLSRSWLSFPSARNVSLERMRESVCGS